MSEWISVRDRMPEEPGAYLVALVTYRQERYLAVAYPRDGWWDVAGWCREYKHRDGVHNFDVTHWMPLPEPPKEDTCS
jgi:hypothetical protein